MMLQRGGMGIWGALETGGLGMPGCLEVGLRPEHLQAWEQTPRRIPPLHPPPPPTTLRPSPTPLRNFAITISPFRHRLFNYALPPPLSLLPSQPLPPCSPVGVSGPADRRRVRPPESPAVAGRRVQDGVSGARAQGRPAGRGAVAGLVRGLGGGEAGYGGGGGGGWGGGGGGKKNFLKV